MPNVSKRTSISAKFKRIIEELSIVTFLEDHGHESKRKEGSEYIYLCPFHDDSRPSFKVNPDKHCFHCFGCKAGEGLGQDIIGLAILIYKMEDGDRKHRRTESAKRLWLDYFDNDAKDEPAAARKKEEETIIINPPSWTFKNTVDEQAREYLATRGITKETQQHFGLTVPLKGTSAGKLAIPLKDHEGVHIGYALRTMADDEPKYILPPKDKGFHKSHVLFNLDAIVEEEDQLILVEGFFDVFHLYQCGYANIAAVMGSTLSETQANLITDRFGYVHIFFDGDQAGEEGAKAAREKLRERGLLAKRVVCPDGRQPEHLGRDELCDLLEASTHVRQNPHSSHAGPR